MTSRIPLYSKILGWFFLNLLLIAAVFVFLFKAQFGLNLDWLLATGARQRVEAVRDLIVGELNNSPPDEWERTLNRYSDAYGVRFSLFDEEGNHLVGGVARIPSDIRDRMTEWNGRPSGAKASGGLRLPSLRSENANERPLPTLMRTTRPTRYWLLAAARIDNFQVGDPMRVTLVSSSSSLSSGGLIFDRTPWLVVGFGALIFSLLFWLPLVRGITRSIAQMTDATRRIAEGRFDVRVDARRRDELGSLGDSINRMAARLASLVEGQKRFLGDIAHELCSPLARLQLALGILEERAGKEQKNYAKVAAEKAQQIASLVNELLSFSKASFGPSAAQIARLPLAEAVAEAVQRETSDEAKIQTKVPGELMVLADRELLVRALSNLIRNALRYASHAGPIAIEATRVSDGTRLTVTDSGPGVPEEELPRIFDAFYRSDPSRTRETGGIGLGLTITKTCIESCGGTVTARNRTPHGLEIIIHLPSTIMEGAHSVGSGG